METPPRTTFIVATDRDALLLEKLTGMEQAIEGLVPLLAQILTHLEALTPPAKPPIATYADLYDEPEAGPPEGELVAAALQPPPSAAAALAWARLAARWLARGDAMTRRRADPLQLGRWGQTHQTAVLTGVLAAPLLLGGLSLARRGRRAATTTHGSARWATAREVRQAGLLAPHGVVLGRHGGRLLADDSETHTLLVAPTRSGKGVGTIIPTLLTWRPSALVLDPKDGENYDVTAPWRARVAGNQIAYFTPCRTPHTCVNVLDTIRVGQPSEVGDTQIVSHCLVSPAEDGARVVHESPLPGAGGPGADGEYPACEVHGAGRLPGAGVVLPDAAAPDPACVPEDLTDDGAPRGGRAPGHCGPDDGAQ